MRTLPQRCDVYDDVATGALRELCLNFYDARAIVVEVCRRADDLCNNMAAAEQWQRQLAALEALQIFAPMGHALGLSAVSAELEDRCFQVCMLKSTIRSRGWDTILTANLSPCKSSLPRVEQPMVTAECMLQELFPRSYAQTAEWLWRERTAYQDTLARCQARLNAALTEDPALASLAATCQVLLQLLWSYENSETKLESDLCSLCREYNYCVPILVDVIRVCH